MDSFFIKVDDKEFGPVALPELRRLIREGSFAEEDTVWSEELNEWVEAQYASELQGLFREVQGQHGSHPTIFAIAGGKGGVGKTILSGSLGIGLASAGQFVTLVDADFGGANLHTCLGILEPESTFFDFYTLKVDCLEDILLPTPVENLNLISGACGTLGIANQKYFQKQRLLRELKKLRADSIILDLGAGSNYNILDFFLLADEKIIVMTPEPTSVHEAFGFIKVSLLRELGRRLKNFPDALAVLRRSDFNRPGKVASPVSDMLAEVKTQNEQAHAIFVETLSNFRPKLILNMVRERQELKESLAIQAAARELLSIEVERLGYISYDPNVVEAVKQMRPFLLHAPKSKASRDLSTLLRVNWLGKKGLKEIVERRQWRKSLQDSGAEYPQSKVLDDSQICSVHCFYWGDCEFEEGGHPCRVRHLEPVIREGSAAQFADRPA